MQNKKSGQNLRQTPGANKRSKIDCLRIQRDIFDLLQTGKYSDLEIMKTVGISNGQYYVYKAKINQECKDIWRQICTDSLEFQAIQIMQSLHDCINVNREIMNNAEVEPRERRDSSKMVVEAQLITYELIKNGPGVGPVQQSEPRYEEPYWFDRTKEPLWDALTKPQQKQRLWIEYGKLNRSKSKIDKEKTKILKEQLGLTWSEDPEYYTTDGI